MPIDPEKLLALAQDRHREGGVTLAWPTVLKIVEELRQLQARARYLERLEAAIPPCRFHDRDTEACMTYCSQVPCEPSPEEGNHATA